MIFCIVCKKQLLEGLDDDFDIILSRIHVCGQRFLMLGRHELSAWVGGMVCYS